MAGQGGSQSLLKAGGEATALLEHLLADQPDCLGGGGPVLGGVLHAGLDLVVQAGDAHHVVLVEVGCVDRAELHTLQQRQLVVLGELQHALVEIQPRDLAVEVERGIAQVALLGLGQVGCRLALGLGLIDAHEDLNATP